MGLVQVEDQGQARYQGWEEGSLRQCGDGEGEACTEDCEGLPSGGPEEQHLSRCREHALSLFHSSLSLEAPLLHRFSWALCGGGKVGAGGKGVHVRAPCAGIVGVRMYVREARQE